MCTVSSLAIIFLGVVAIEAEVVVVACGVVAFPFFSGQS